VGGRHAEERYLLGENLFSYFPWLNFSLQILHFLLFTPPIFMEPQGLLPHSHEHPIGLFHTSLPWHKIVCSEMVERYTNCSKLCHEIAIK
jgi:hypothetical protein